MVEVRRGRARSEAVRQAILAATRDELVAHGYDKLSIDRIAAAAGAGKQTVYRWYPSKTELIADCLLESRVFGAVRPLDDTGDLRHDLRVWMHGLVARFNDPGSAAYIRAATAAAAENDEVARRFYEHNTAAAEAALTARLGSAVAAQALIGAVIYRVLTRQPVTTAIADDLVDALAPTADRRTVPGP